MNFGEALELLKNGEKLTRGGWNGKGMFVVYQKGYPDGIPCNKQTAEAWGLEEGDKFVCNPYLQIKNVNGSHSMWVPSINDVLSEDWEVIVTKSHEEINCGLCSTCSHRIGVPFYDDIVGYVLRCGVYTYLPGYHAKDCDEYKDLSNA